MTPRRRRVSWWVVGVLAVVVNFPLVNHWRIERSIDRSGVLVDADLVDAARTGEGADADHGVAFRFPEDVDPAQSIWTSEVDRATYQRAVDSEAVEVRVVPGRPAAFEIVGEVTTRLGYYVTGVADAGLAVAALVLWRRGRRLPEDLEAQVAQVADEPVAPPPPDAARPVPAVPPAPDPTLHLEALEDVQRHVPALGPPAGLEDLGGATYLVTGEVSGVAADAVVVDTGTHRVHVSLGRHSNLVAGREPGQVLAREADPPGSGLPDWRP